MARSVSTPSEASDVAYATFEGDEYDFRDAVSEMQAAARRRYPSLSKCDRWIGRENHAVLENRYCTITVSEYCGLVAVAIVPGSGYSLSDSWCSKVNLEPLVEYFGQALRLKGVFSNGEAIFQPADGVQKGDMGLGFTSKEGWL